MMSQEWRNFIYSLRSRADKNAFFTNHTRVNLSQQPTNSHAPPTFFFKKKYSFPADSTLKEKNVFFKNGSNKKNCRLQKKLVNGYFKASHCECDSMQEVLIPTLLLFVIRIFCVNVFICFSHSITISSPLGASSFDAPLNLLCLKAFTLGTSLMRVQATKSAAIKESVTCTTTFQLCSEVASPGVTEPEKSYLKLLKILSFMILLVLIVTSVAVLVSSTSCSILGFEQVTPSSPRSKPCWHRHLVELVTGSNPHTCWHGCGAWHGDVVNSKRLKHDGMMQLLFSAKN